jgi:Uma2 family endonuclease
LEQQMTALRKAERYPMTYAEYCLLPDDGNRYQVLEGELIVSPAPRLLHQDVVLQLALLLRSYVISHDLGKVYISPVDVILSPTTIVQPDVVFVRREHMEMITDQNIQGPPDLCVEVLSPGTESIDRERKKALYARFGVREYWIVDPVRETVTVFGLQDGAYVLRIEASGDGVVSSSVLTGFETPAEVIFS